MIFRNMYTLSFFCSFLGFFFLYNTSRKAQLSRAGRFEKWLQSNALPARVTGIALVILSFIILVTKDGWGPGFLTALLLLMVAGCYITILAPLTYLKASHAVLIACFSLFTELIIF